MQREGIERSACGTGVFPVGLEGNQGNRQRRQERQGRKEGIGQERLPGCQAHEPQKQRRRRGADIGHWKICATKKSTCPLNEPHQALGG
jgi:hypothetical protein